MPDQRHEFTPMDFEMDILYRFHIPRLVDIGQILNRNDRFRHHWRLHQFHVHGFLIQRNSLECFFHLFAGFLQRSR